MNIALDDDAHERLKEWKNDRGMTWGEVLFHGVDTDE